MTRPTHDDVTTLLKLYDMAMTPDLREARMWMLTDFRAVDYAQFSQHYPLGSAEWRRFTDVCGILELFGVLLKYELIPEDLLFDLFGGIDILWEIASGVIFGMRQAIDPRLYENFELLCQRAREWQARRAAA